jgi:FlaG protein
MSFDIAPVAQTPSAAPPSAAQPAGAAAPAPATAKASDPVTVDTIPASPPPEVQDAMGVAAKAYQDLKDQGSELRFKVDEPSGKLVIEVHDTHGKLLFTLPPHKVLDVAAGGSLQ